MPVYLFTYHAYGSWWPDRPQGFVQEGKGIQPTNSNLAVAYKEAAKYQAVRFSGEIQKNLIKKLHHIAETDSLVVYGISVDPTHLHVLTGWQDGRDCIKVRGRIKNLLSLHLSRSSDQIGRPWFVKKASRKQVKEETHFEYLMKRYFPKHVGWQWYRDRGWVEPPSRDGGYSSKGSEVESHSGQ